MADEAARPGSQPTPPLPKRFYAEAAVAEREGAFALTLDGRLARTPGRAPLAVASRALADAVATEWQAQIDVIDPARMPITRLVNSALDGVASRMAEVRADLLRYAGSDLVCYRASDPDSLVAAQNAAWNPILAWARETFGARFVLSEGVMFVAQPEPSLAAIGSVLSRETSPEALAALHVMTTLSGSLLIALAHAQDRLSVEEAWAAAHVDEFFQEQRWGIDADAVDRRNRRRIDFLAASRVRALSR